MIFLVCVRQQRRAEHTVKPQYPGQQMVQTDTKFKICMKPKKLC